MFLRQNRKKQCANQNHKDETHLLACSLHSVHVRTHVFNTFIWNCSEYSKVSRIYLYILVVFQQLPGFMYWAARDHRYNMSIGFCLSVSVPIRASPSRLLLLFKGLAAPSPLKQKEKRDWVRLPPSDQNTSSKTIGGKKKNKTLRNRQDTATFQTLEILYRTTNPRNIITCIWCTRYSLFFFCFFGMTGQIYWSKWIWLNCDMWQLGNLAQAKCGGFIWISMRIKPEPTFLQNHHSILQVTQRQQHLILGHVGRKAESCWVGIHLVIFQRDGRLRQLQAESRHEPANHTANTGGQTDERSVL